MRALRTIGSISESRHLHIVFAIAFFSCRATVAGKARNLRLLYTKERERKKETNKLSFKMGYKQELTREEQ